jgi:prepilin-type processing-associated H-X9-DG protein
MRQLGMAFTAYVMNNGEYFPRPGVGTSVDDWIFWEPSRDITKGAIAPYLGSTISADIYRCPSDRWAERTNNYKYSYSVNYLICRLPPTGWAGIYSPDNNDTLRLTQIVDPSSKILLIDESADTLDDGCWAWQQTLGSGKNVMANRHDRSKEAITDPNAGYGNASYADGHAEFASRSQSFNKFYYDPKYRP